MIYKLFDISGYNRKYLSTNPAFKTSGQLMKNIKIGLRKLMISIKPTVNVCLEEFSVFKIYMQRKKDIKRNVSNNKTKLN